MADPAGILRGHDVSHHQSNVDVGRLAVDFIVARTGQAPGGKYGKTVDSMYSAHKANARRGTKRFSSYFYLGNGVSPSANADQHAAAEPDRGVPVMLDWEQGSGDGAFLRACAAAFAQRGYYVWGLYAPRWYWQAQGSPDFGGLPPLVSSRYADMIAGSWQAEYRSTPDSYWLPYANNSVAMLQFSSVVRDPAYPGINLDGLAFHGSLAQLGALWSPHASNPELPHPQGVSDVSLISSINVKASPSSAGIPIRSLPGGPNCKIIVRVPGIDWKTRETATPVWQGHVYAYGDRNVGIGHDPVFTPGFDPKILSDTEIPLPGALNAWYEYSCASDFVLEIYG